jgi:transposase
MGKPRRKYTEEFKRDAVRMMRNRGTRTVAEVADDLGLVPNLLHRWASKTERDAVAKRNAEGETLEQEVRRLRKEVESLRLDKAILKKAAAFFAKGNRPDRGVVTGWRAPDIVGAWRTANGRRSRRGASSGHGRRAA